MNSSEWVEVGRARQSKHGERVLDADASSKGEASQRADVPVTSTILTSSGRLRTMRIDCETTASEAGERRQDEAASGRRVNTAEHLPFSVSVKRPETHPFRAALLRACRLSRLAGLRGYLADELALGTAGRHRWRRVSVQRG